MKKIALMVSLSLGTICAANAASYPPAPDVGQLGTVITNPFKNAPLTAVIGLAGNTISDVSVKVHGKGANGIDIEYEVGPKSLLNNDGIPIWGMYASHRNKVTVSFVKDGKKYVEDYTIQTSGISNRYLDSRDNSDLMTVDVKKVSPEFKDSLYFVNSFTYTPDGTNLSWAAQKAPKKKGAQYPAVKTTGAMFFDMAPMNFVIDSQGEYRWWMEQDAIYDGFGIDAEQRGLMMGFNQTDKGSFTFTKGQRWGEFDMMGRFLVDQRLPHGYVDASHEAHYTSIDTVMLRVGKQNYRRDDGVMVNTVRDHIVEVDRLGNVQEVWDLTKILDPMRDDLLTSLDLGAVCLNVDMDSIGKKATAEPDADLGDIPGVGAGRNWAHVNSIWYDKNDDSIILSLRHQATVKIGRDKEVKWILSPNTGWGELSNKVLTPVDARGNKLNCEGARCEGTDFDWSYTQHTSWGNDKGTVTVFDNGDGRFHEQPAMPTMKYSRFVEYKVDPKNMTVQQLWEYGKEQGYDWYSPITSNTEYDARSNTMFSFSGSVFMFERGEPTIGKISEINYDTKEIEVEIDVLSNKDNQPHYRALKIYPDTLFSE
ncbi:aryl-sulfate sulfotransferase [Ferrimonas pelagia]|uniref:Aryl-sulfate sulfotransferase n=1 Tax=Ferrimonas pelagia TaxID=1177826 RepID=A0ABP9EL27_9GAMM